MGGMNDDERSAWLNGRLRSIASIAESIVGEMKAYVGDGKGRIVLEEDGRIEYENGSFVARVERGGRIYGIEVSRVD